METDTLEQLLEQLPEVVENFTEPEKPFKLGISSFSNRGKRRWIIAYLTADMPSKDLFIISRGTLRNTVLYALEKLDAAKQGREPGAETIPNPD